MKKLMLAALAAVALFSCQKAKETDPAPSSGESTVNIKINVNKALTKAVENGHAGANDATVTPKIYAVTVVAYNEYGTELNRIGLNNAQMADAVWGNYRNPDGSAGANTTASAGASVGLPAGTKKVDVIVNWPTSENTDRVTNINYYNYRDNKDGNGDAYANGNDNFDRVFLTTGYYGQGVALQGHETPGGSADDKVPSYSLDFTVKPYMTRMEVYGAVDVAESAIWVDFYNNHWSTMTVAAYEAATGDTPDADGYYKKGAVKGTGPVAGGGNGFDANTVYITEYYWYVANGSVATPVPRTSANQHDTEAEIDNIGTDNQGWVKNLQYNDAQKVTWLPNMFYAVDVEEVYVNNIKVRTPASSPYLHPWPGSQSSTYWPSWYNAYHIGGWHTAGVSVGNTFLCMGNMWDRIAESAQTQEITFPSLEGVDHMTVLTGKAQAVSGKSEFYSANRNLGVARGKAAAYEIYPQSKGASTAANDAETLRGEMPHIILKVKCYDNQADYAAGTYVPGKEFITIKLFADGSDLSTARYIYEYKAGYIYRFELDELLKSFVGEAPVPGGIHPGGTLPTDPVDPDPEIPGAELIMKVEILPWTIQNIYPVI